MASKLLFTLMAVAGLSSPAYAQTVVDVYPGDDLQTLVDANAPGTEFLIKPGIHRGQQVRPKDGDTFTGEPGAVLSGAKVLDNWAREGPYWITSGQSSQGQVHGACTDAIPGYEGCRYSEDLFFDDRPLWQETRLTDLDAPGEWFFDYEADKIYVLDEPFGAKVELSVTRHAFHGSARDVTIQGLTIEKYAAPAQHGAVHSQEGTSGAVGVNWVVQDNVIRLNHGRGIRTGHGTRVLRNQLVSNGQLGIGGGCGTDVWVENNVISWNNYAGFNPKWEAGGGKWAAMEGLTVSGNRVEGNWGPGLWTDIDSIHVVYEDNTVLQNSHAGIFHEISYEAIITRNSVSDNGQAFDPWLWGAQILVSNSSDVEVCDNVVLVGQAGGNGIALILQDRGSGIYGPRLTVNNYVHDNRVIYLGDRGLTGGVADWEAEVLFEGNNRFDQNDYYVGDSSERHWTWVGEWQDWAAWQGSGQDPIGSVQPESPIEPVPEPGAGPLTMTGLLSLAIMKRRRRA